MSIFQKGSLLLSKQSAIWLLGVAFVGSQSVQAQVARVAAVQRITEKRAGADAAWASAGAGTSLGINDRFRTGKRSKADVKFTDGSLLRLGQLSSIEVRSTKGVALLGGQLLFSALRPGRVLAGTAAAEIKGSVGIIALNEDGSSEFELHTGAMDVVTPEGKVELRPGMSVRVRADGTLSAIRSTLPFAFADGTSNPELLEGPSNSPTVGSQSMARERAQPARSALANNAQRAAALDISPDRPSPFPTAFPTVPPRIATARNAAPNATTTNANRPNATTLTSANTATPSGASPRVLSGTRFAAQGAESPLPSANDLDIAAATAHLNDVDPNRGSGGSGDFRLIGVYGDGGRYAYGGRLSASGAQGRWLTEVELTPLRVSSGSGRVRNLSTVSAGSVTYRLRNTQIKAGRQRFLEGPTQAAVLGSMVRQGGRDTMDALSLTHQMGSGRLQLAYLHDAFPRNFPFQRAGSQKGLYGRYSIQRSIGNFGLNLLNYRNAPVSSGTGITFDFAVPLIRNQVELYGEVGRDPYRRRLTTVGVALPGLYDATDFDVYLEYASIARGSAATDLPSELALLIYRRLSDNTNLLMAVNRFSDIGTRFTLGLSTGGSLSARDYR
ncbi:MAG: hypothetical protein JWN98_1477 [Abditibacteriota bacterium]|nr:hypothetical protein [Abditibacteriota bacterium]